MAGIELDHYTAVLLVLRPDAPVLSEQEAAALQDAHLAHIAALHDAGHLLAAGPLRDPELRGLSILRVDVEQARALKAEDPAVRAGRLEARCYPWLVPRGALVHTPARFPRAIADLAD